MARGRLISKEFFTSGDLEDLGAKAKVLFAGLIVFADDAGVIRHQLRFYRNTILHGERASLAWIEHVLGVFCARSMLTPCTLESVKCYRITNFSQFQRLKRREGKRREDEGEGEGEALAARERTPKATPDPTTEEAEELRLRLEGGYTEGAAELIREIRRLVSCSAAKARDLIGEGFTAADIPKWREFEKREGSERMRISLLAHVHVEGVPATVPTPSPLQRRRQERAQAIERMFTSTNGGSNGVD